MEKSTTAPRKAVMSLSLVLALAQVFAGLKLVKECMLPIPVMDTVLIVRS